MTGHQHHFLSRLDRVPLPHVELALMLYRDDGLVKYLLQNAKLPEGTERVAIALEHAEQGPFLVVTRDGTFVTCLAAGMKAGGLPVLTRGQLDVMMSKVGDLRARMQAAQALAGPKGRTAKLLERIYTAGPFLSREEFIGISAFQPLLDMRLLHAYFHTITSLDEARDRLLKIERPKASFSPLLRAYWEAFWAVGHLAVLAFMDGRALVEGLPPELDMSGAPLSWGAVRQGVFALALRGTWAVAKVGKTQLKICKDALDSAPSPLRLITSSTALIALGLRHAKLQAEVRKALVAPKNPESVLYRPELLKILQDCAHVAFEAPEQAAALQRKVGAAMAVKLTQSQPRGAIYRFERPQDVPEELAMTLATYLCDGFISASDKLMLLVLSLPWVARAAPEQFFLPRDFLRVTFPRWTPAQTIELLAPLREHYGKPGQVRPEGPTRNGPCPCGSGKKYKRCCGPKAEAGAAD
jgi:hypothetical protein